jgi:CelD/BcsL family acetyltransferase involved in cellulose biosynthesis
LVEVLTVLVPAGLAVVWEFRRHDELVGSFVNFCNARTFYQYLGGFAPEWRHLSIGKLATAEGIRASIAAGRSYYDFARGHEHQKYWFGAVDQFSAGTVFTRPALSWTRKPRLGALAARLWG